MPRGASEASPPRRSWADLDGDDLPPPREFFAGSPGLLRAFLGRGPAEHVAFSDSEGYSDPEPTPSPAPPSSSTLRSALPAPDAKEKAPAEPSRRRRHRRRRHRRGQRLPAPVPQASPSHPRLQSTVFKVSPPRRRSPPAAHPPRELGTPDADGFFPVLSRRFGQSRSPSRSPRKVPPELEGRCFHCLREDHTRAGCSFPERCYNCWEEGHRAAVCLRPSRSVGDKRRRSVSPLVHRRVLRRLPRGGLSCASADTVSARSASTGRSASASPPPPPPPPPPPLPPPPLPTAEESVFDPPEPGSDVERERGSATRSVGWAPAVPFHRCAALLLDPGCRGRPGASAHGDGGGNQAGGVSRRGAGIPSPPLWPDG